MNKNIDVQILGLSFTQCKTNDILSRFKISILNHKKLTIMPFDFRHLFYADQLTALNQNADLLIYPDSSGIFFLLKTFYRKQFRDFQRLVSTNIHYKMMDAMNVCKAKLFLLGDTEETLGKFISKINSTYSNIQVAGKLDGFGNYTTEKIINEIVKQKPDVVMIGMGVPRQEITLINIKDHIGNTILVTVGAFFSFYSGVVPRAPELFQKYYIEWLYRLYREPKRLAARYFIMFPKVVFKLIKNR